MSSTVDENFSQQKMNEFRDKLGRLNEFMGPLMKRMDFETDIMEKIKLEEQIKDKKAEREQIMKEVEELELKIKKQQNQREKRELIKLADQRELSKSYGEAIEIWRMAHELDLEDFSVEKQIERLKSKLEHADRLNRCIKQLFSRISEIRPVGKRVIERLREIEPAENDTEVTLCEEFLQQRMTAEDFMNLWEGFEQEPLRISDSKQPNYSILAERLSRGEIILFLGSDIPRLSGITNFDLEKLIKGLAAKVDYKNFTGTLSMIAQYYEMSDYGRSSLVRNLNNLIEERNIPEIKLYKVLAMIEKPLVLISAAYDMFLENCFRIANKKYALISSVICSRDNYRIGNLNHNLRIGNVIVRYSDRQEVRILESGQELSNLEDLRDYSLIYKIRGYCDSVEQGIGQVTWTLTEENYFDFARNIGNSIPDYIVKQFNNRIVYFLGYSTKHWEDRLLVSLILNLNRFESAKVVTQTDDNFEIAYWRWKKVEIYPIDLKDFVARLEDSSNE